MPVSVTITVPAMAASHASNQTAPNPLDLEAVAGILSALTGRTIRRVTADDQEWTDGLIDHGIPESQVNMLLGMFHASRRCEIAATGPTLPGRDCVAVARQPLPARHGRLGRSDRPV